MALRFREYVNAELMVEEGTPGGDTYIVDGHRLCFRFLSRHHRAIKALTGDASLHANDIRPDVVAKMESQGILSVDMSRCISDYGYMGAVVKDEDGKEIGEIGIRCANLAGANTDHNGYGACHIHQFQPKLIGLKTARDATKRRESLTRRIEEYASDPNRLDLGRELGTQRTMLEAMVEQLAALLDMDDIGEDTTRRSIVRLQEQIVRLSDLVGRQVERIVTIDQKHALSAGQVLYLQAVVIDVLNRWIENPTRRDMAARDLMERLGSGSALRQAIGIEQLLAVVE